MVTMKVCPRMSIFKKQDTCTMVCTRPEATTSSEACTLVIDLMCIRHMYMYDIYLHMTCGQTLQSAKELGCYTTIMYVCSNIHLVK